MPSCAELISLIVLVQAEAVVRPQPTPNFFATEVHDESLLRISRPSPRSFFCQAETAFPDGVSALSVNGSTITSAVSAFQPADRARGRKRTICVYGLTKFAWAVALTTLAMATFFACIVLLLAVAKRRPPGHSIISCPWWCCWKKRSGSRDPPLRVGFFYHGQF
eukprot:TRINITY_DN56591_c0_g1_i1.p1 TRINITY_DN56591_c0_g1~~TRINITY_DN56591_c0_g1_i1.p1  ORF type:complete len:164 (+),score=14.88 TRINITY_DN56591_c0_g1_i1:100-591(+)